MLRFRVELMVSVPFRTNLTVIFGIHIELIDIRA